MLAPLDTLSNVISFELHPILPFSQPRQRYEKMIQDLTEKIERNWQLSQGLQPSFPSSVAMKIIVCLKVSIAKLANKKKARSATI